MENRIKKAVSSELFTLLERQAPENIVNESNAKVKCWQVTSEGGFPDVPEGSLVHYISDGSMPTEGLYVIQENKPHGKLYVRKLCHEIQSIRLIQTEKGERVGEDIIIDLRDHTPKYICCGKVRIYLLVS